MVQGSIMGVASSTILDLFVDLTQDIAVVVTFAYLLSQTFFFRKILNKRLELRDKLILSLLFGIIGIYGTYAGIPIYGALANSRVLGPVVGGLLGGPWVGLGAGLIAGVHRFWLGGFTGFACGISTILEGILGGLIQSRLKGRTVTWPLALAVGAAAELMQMLIILAIAKPFWQAKLLVEAIGLPMIGVNSIGVAIFFVIIRSVLTGQNQVGAELAQRVLGIANLTLPFLRHGLTKESALRAAETIYKLSTFSAVAITDTSHILAHVGAGSDHHKPGKEIQTQSSKKVLATNQTYVARNREEIGCRFPNCPLGGAVLAPLRHKGEVIGVLKLYRESPSEINSLDIEFAQGLAAIFETQMDLAQLERQKELLAKAELRALQAQINPHFLFNALNTISTFIRTKPDCSRELLYHLSDFLRRNLQGGKEMVSLAEELEHVRDYLAIEKARFGERLEVIINIPAEILKETVPSLIIQPIVENAVRHGLANRKKGGTVTISGYLDQNIMVITIADNGVGIGPDKLKNLFVKDSASEAGLGIGLRNVQERLYNLYGKRFPLQVESDLGQGTIVTLRIPVSKEDKRYDNSNGRR